MVIVLPVRCYWNTHSVATGWKSVPAFETIQTLICRTSHRIFVGLPLCMSPACFGVFGSDSASLTGRDPGWNALILGSATAILKEIIFLRLIPNSIIS